MSKLLKDSVLYAGGAMLIRSLGIILIPLYTKHFSLAEYGALAILNIFIQLFSTVFVFGVNSAATRFYFREDYNADARLSMYGTAFLMLAVLPVVAGLFVMPGMMLLATEVYGLPFFPFFFIALLIGVFKPLEKLATGLMRVQKRAVHYVLFYVTMFLVQFIAIYFFVAYRRLGLAGQLYGQLVAAAMFYGIAIILLRRQIRMEFDRSMATRLLQYGLPLLPYFLFVWFDVAAPRILLERLGSLDDVGLFALASQFSGLLLLVGNACDNALIPHYYELAGSQEAGEKIGKLATKFVGIAALVSLGIYMFADDFIRAFANERFHGAISLISCLVLASFLRLTYRLVHWNLMSTERTQIVSLLRGIGFTLLTGFILLWVGFYGFGIWGIIAAMISSEGILLVAGVFVSQKYFRVHYDFAKLATILCIVIVSGIALELVQWKLGSVTGFFGGFAILSAASILILWFIEVRISMLPIAFLRVR